MSGETLSYLWVKENKALPLNILLPNTYTGLLVTMKYKLHFNLNSDIINKTVVVESIATSPSVSGTKGSDDDDVEKN